MKKLLWLPIDLPKFPIKDFTVDIETTWNFWNFGKITESRPSPYDITEIKQTILDKHPELSAWFNLFPIKTIRNIKFNIQQSEVVEHIDFTRPEANPDLFSNNNQNEPCGYRIVLLGARQNKMYVTDNNVRTYVDMPDDTDVYVLRHTDGLHGVDDETGRITIFTHFEIDPIKHNLLIERSLLKYGSHAVWSNT